MFVLKSRNARRREDSGAPATDASENEDGKIAGAQLDPVSAYTWYLAEKAAAPMLEQIEEGKKNISQAMSPQ